MIAATVGGAGAECHSRAITWSRFGMAMRIGAGALMDRTLISAAELPGGLTMLLGDLLDETEYQKQHATRV